MTQWAQSLIRISGYEVETLQKRLAEIATRRATAEMRLAVLDAERELETDHARAMEMEEEGARDALMSAFEELKKFEHVAEVTRLNELAALARRESAAMDEQAILRAARA